METIKLITRSKSGRLIKIETQIEKVKGRIEFINSPFALKDEIKAMAGSRWGGTEDPPRKNVWSVKDCERNWFQIRWLMGENPYEWWERPVVDVEFDRPLKTYQKMQVRIGLTYHYAIIAAEMGLGKTLVGIELMERSGFHDWWWVSPKSGLEAVKIELRKWNCDMQPQLMTYDRLRIMMEEWQPGDPIPQGIILDESSRAKGATSKRTCAAQLVADEIRRRFGKDGFVILMSGSPAPKSPLDWWSQCEIAWPGFVKEGSAKGFEWRLGVFKKQKTEQGDFHKRITWKDDEKKCSVCGQLKEHEEHQDALYGGTHGFVPCVNEVALLQKRLAGLAWPFFKKDWLPELPDMIYRELVLEPSSTIKRVAKALAQSAPTAIQGLTWLRELSDGFQYREVQDGTKECPCCNGVGEVEAWEIEGKLVYEQGQLLAFEDMLTRGAKVNTVIATCDLCHGEKVVPNMIRESREVPCPKEDALKDLLDENSDQGRLVTFAGFQGSIDRCTRVSLNEGWDVGQIDGRGWKVLTPNGGVIRVDLLQHWMDLEKTRRMNIVAHPASGGMGLTLTESRMAVYYSNDFSPESRTQSKARIHRLGMDVNKGATIVDLLHLPTDKKVLDVLNDNRRLEMMTLQEFREMVE